MSPGPGAPSEGTRANTANIRVDEVIPEIVGRAGLRVEDVTKVRVRDARRDLEDYRIDVSRVAG